jgi:hypothetical protein
MPRKPKRPKLPNLPHLRPVCPKGKWYVYVQRHGSGKAYRITADYKTEPLAFIEQYKDAVAQLERMPVSTPNKDAATLSGLYSAFKKSAKWASYSEGTVKSKTRRLDQLMRDHGWKRYGQLNRNTMQDLHDRWCEDNGTEQAKKFLADLSPMFEFAVQRGYAGAEWVNPCHNITRRKPENAQGFRVWEPHHLQQYEQHHPIGTMPRLTFVATLTARRGCILTGRKQAHRLTCRSILIYSTRSSRLKRAIWSICLQVTARPSDQLRATRNGSPLRSSRQVCRTVSHRLVYPRTVSARQALLQWQKTAPAIMN